MDVNGQNTNTKALENIEEIEEINNIQKEIEKYTRNIEHEKMNFRLAKERYDKSLEDLNMLQNEFKPGFERNQEVKKRRKSIEVLDREKIKYDFKIKALNEEINTIAEDNKLLRINIEELRKEKINCISLLDSTLIQNEQTKKKFDEIYIRNRHNNEDKDGLLSKNYKQAFNYIDRKKRDLEQVEALNENEVLKFEEKRDKLEKKYQVSIF